MEPVGHHGQNGTFKRSNEPLHEILLFPEFRYHFCQKIIWTSIKTLAMDPICHHGHNGPFKRSNEI
ncbi:hypothetical protein H5410_029304 [Solanum commersonii]|uniref:Uncharacterized protein n=1 Tax=Solanum commersonii TaxID=4109 RepID=A0A9J5Z8L9_SOLCO|nr:hypothetical protein H5410_029304 [Solanum commersonii]